jgi:hypothetical protein
MAKNGFKKHHQFFSAMCFNISTSLLPLFSFFMHTHSRQRFVFASWMRKRNLLNFAAAVVVGVVVVIFLFNEIKFISFSFYKFLLFLKYFWAATKLIKEGFLFLHNTFLTKGAQLRAKWMNEKLLTVNYKWKLPCTLFDSV